jgi:hypothetical protein
MREKERKRKRMQIIMCAESAWGKKKTRSLTTA